MFGNGMNKRLFLYIDILGFKELIKDTEKVLRLYSILDQARIHYDSSFRSIVFSDTIVAYNIHSNYTDEAKAVEVMFLIELTKDIFHLLIGTGIYFRAVITEGEFFHDKFENLEAYFGEALVEAYLEEKQLEGTGLYLNNCLRDFNRTFRFKKFSEKFDYIYLTHWCSGITSWLNRNVDEIDKPDFDAYPLHENHLEPHDLAYLVYAELVHFKDVYQKMNNHPNPRIRSKFLTTWNMYCHAYPGLTRNLIKENFNPNGLSIHDWSDARKMFEEIRAEQSVRVGQQKVRLTIS